MNSQHCDEAFFALLEAEVREQEHREMKRAHPTETEYTAGRKGSTLHFKGRGRQGFQLKCVSERTE